MWGWTWLEDTVQDVRYAFRLLVKNPGFALVAIASLALGTGANTAIFQLLDAVRLRSLPIRNPQELAEVRIVGGHGGMGVNPGGYPELTQPIWEEIREHHEPLSGVFAWSADVVRVGQGSELRRAKGIYVMARRRNEIGIRMALGAQRGQVVAMVMREAGRLLVIGVVAGTALSLVAGRSASSLLFGLKPYDPLTLVGAGCTVGCIRGSGHLPARAPGLQGRSHGGAALRVAGLVPISRL